MVFLKLIEYEGYIYIYMDLYISKLHIVLKNLKLFDMIHSRFYFHRAKVANKET